MPRLSPRITLTLLVSLLLHGLLALVLATIRVEKKDEPVRVTLREVAPPPEAAATPPPPEPEPAAPEPVAPTPATLTPAAPKPAPVKAEAPKPAPAVPPPAEAPPPAAPANAASGDVPDFGLALGAGTGVGGVAVPVGEPSGGPGGGGPTRKQAEPKKLEATTAKDDGCAEEPTKPQVQDLEQPAYTDSAQAAGVQGKVRLEVQVAEDGRLVDVHVVQPLHPDLDAAAIAAVKAARFAPSRRCGQAIAAKLKLGFTFQL